MRWGRVFGVVVALSVVLSLGKFLPLASVDATRVRKLVSADRDLAHMSSPIALQRNGELLIADRHSGAAACATCSIRSCLLWARHHQVSSS